MKNYLQTFLLTLAILLGFQSAVAYDWYIVGGSYGWGKTGVQFKATTDADIYEAYLENAKLNDNGGFRIKCGSNFSGDADWQYSLCGEGPLKLEVPATFVYQDAENKGVDGNSYGNTQLYSNEAFTGYIRITVPDPTNSNNQPTVLLTTEAYSSGDDPDPVETWYVVVGNWSSKDHPMTLYPRPEGKDEIWTLKYTSFPKNIWFKFRTFEEGLVDDNVHQIGIGNSGNTNISSSTTWTQGVDGASGNFVYTGDADDVVIFINTSRNKVVLVPANQAEDFDPYYEPSVDPDEQDVVFFGGAAGPDITKVELVFNTTSGTETLELWKAGDAYWKDKEYFYGKKIDVAKYTGLASVKVTLKDGSKFFGTQKTDNVATGTFTIKDAGADGWYKYIISHLDQDEANGAVSAYPTYCTPERYLEISGSTEFKNRVLVLGANATVNGQSLTWSWKEFVQNPVRIDLFNGVASVPFEYNSGVEQKFKIGYFPVATLIQEEGISINNIDDKRAWVTFDLGLCGGAVDDASVVPAPSCDMALRIPQQYNLYSTADWLVKKVDNLSGTLYLVVDSDPRFRSVTLLTFDPRVKIDEFIVSHQVIDFDESRLPEGKTAKDYALKGSSEDGYAYPEKLNEMSGTAKITPAYYSAQGQGASDIIENYDREFHFYNCKCDYIAGGTASAVDSHNEDEEIGVYYTAISGALEKQTQFKINNLATYRIPQLMVQTEYLYKDYTEDNTEHIARGFRTVPVGQEAEETDIKALKPVLDEKPWLLFTYPETDGSAWGLQVIVPYTVEEGETPLYSIPAYEATCNGESVVEPAHGGMSEVFRENCYNWPIIGYTPAGDSDYDHATHNWAKFCDKYRAHDFVIRNVAADNTAVEKATSKTGTGVTVTAYLAYPYVEYLDNILEKVDDAPQQVRALASNDANSKYEVNYNYVADTKTYYTGTEEGDNIITGVENISVAGEDAQPEYYNLQGLKVSEPLTPGVYIVRCGTKTYKRLVK